MVSWIGLSTKFDVGDSVADDAVAAMLGPTGNMRAPTLRVGSTVIVGYNEEAFTEFFDG